MAITCGDGCLSWLQCPHLRFTSRGKAPWQRSREYLDQENPILPPLFPTWPPASAPSKPGPPFVGKRPKVHGRFPLETNSLYRPNERVAGGLVRGPRPQS
jgi:hypothetical protein